MIPSAIADAVRGLHQAGWLQPHGDLGYLHCGYPPDPACVAARRRLLVAFIDHLSPLRLLVIDPEGDAADLDALGLASEGAARLVTRDTDLDALDRTSLHAGAWLLYKARHVDLRPLIGDDDPFRTDILAQIVARGDADLIVASYWNDSEWLIAFADRPG